MTEPPNGAADTEAKPSDPNSDNGNVVRQPEPPPAPPVVPPATKPPEGFWAKNAVALAGIAATLIAACVGAVLTYKATMNTLASEREQSSIEFQRTERETAYSDFLAKALLLERVENKVDTTRYSRPLQPNQQMADELSKWQVAADQLITSAASVDLLGSGTVRLRALDLRDAHNEVSNAYFDLNVEYMSLPQNREAIDAAVKEFESKRSDAVNARFEFTDAASKSLGISILGP